MPRPHNPDRPKALQMLREGRSISEVVLALPGVTAPSLYRWAQQTGLSQPEHRPHRPHKSKRVDILEMLLGNPEAPTDEIGDFLGITGQAVRLARKEEKELFSDGKYEL